MPVESIYESHGEDNSKNDLQIALQKQFPANYLLKGLKTWNISLSQTVNNLPPVVQQDFIPSACNVKPTRAAIDSIRTIARMKLVNMLPAAPGRRAAVCVRGGLPTWARRDCARCLS